jgi:hypothetical protein
MLVLRFVFSTLNPATVSRDRKNLRADYRARQRQIGPWAAVNHDNAAVFSPLWKVSMSDRNIRAIEHKFRVGQSVDFFPGRGIDHRSKGQYTVVLLRPFDGDAPQYRIKSKVDGQERIVRENELGSR